MTENGKINIGVFLSGDDDQLQGIIMDGIKERAAEKNCGVVAFHSLVNKSLFDATVLPAESVIRGEGSVFFGHDLSALDAVIILGESFQSDDVKRKIIKKSRELNIPIINIDDTEENCSNIRYDDTSGMEMVVRHIIEHHKCKKVYFISGFEGNRQSEERIIAYRQVMEENGYPVKDSWVGYGHFYKHAREEIQRMVEAEGVPDAVICANDFMAMMVMSYLRQEGVRIPEECIVAGFDGISEGQSYIPSLTTCKRSIRASGIKAVDMALEEIAGEKHPLETILEPEMVLGQSCGCKPRSNKAFDQFFEIMNGRVNDKELFNTNLISLSRDFVAVKELKDIFAIVFKYIDTFGLSEFSFYINSNIIQSNMSRNNDENKKKVYLAENIYTDTMTRYTWKKDEEGFTITEIEKKDFLSRLFEKIDGGITTLSPLFFQERILGFARYDETVCPQHLDHLCTLLLYVSATIGDFCLRQEMQYLIIRLDNMYVSDNLTGLYNRFGLYRDAEQMLKAAKVDKKKVFGVEIDLDRLKYVNDTFGHEAGDNAIVQIANAIRYASNLSTIMSRIGGDEYFAIDFCNSEDDAREFIEKLNDFLKKYNGKAGLPYEVDCSCGYYIADPDEPLEDIMKKADERMYKVKVAKKAARQVERKA